MGPVDRRRPPAGRPPFRQVVAEASDEAGEPVGLVGLPPVAAGRRRSLLRFGLFGSAPLGGGEGVEALPPVVALDHAGGPRHPLPRPGRQPSTVTVEQPRRQQRQHVAAPEAAVGQSEQRPQGAAHQPLADGPHRCAVVGDAGGGKVLVQQPDVGVGRSVDDRHPPEGHTRPGRGHDVADDAAHLLVGIADRQDPVCRRRGRAPLVTEVDAGPAERPAEALVGRYLPGEPDDHPHGAVGRQRPEEGGARGREGLGQVHDDRAGWRCRLDGGGGGAEEVVLVVPGRPQEVADTPVDAHHLGRSGRRLSHGLEVGLAHCRQLPVGGHQRLLGGRVVGDRSEHAGSLGQHQAHRLGDHRR